MIIIIGKWHGGIKKRFHIYFDLHNNHFPSAENDHIAKKNCWDGKSLRREITFCINEAVGFHYDDPSDL